MKDSPPYWTFSEATVWVATRRTDVVEEFGNAIKALTERRTRGKGSSATHDDAVSIMESMQRDNKDRWAYDITDSRKDLFRALQHGPITAEALSENRYEDVGKDVWGKVDPWFEISVVPVDCFIDQHDVLRLHSVRLNTGEVTSAWPASSPYDQNYWDLGQVLFYMANKKREGFPRRAKTSPVSAVRMSRALPMTEVEKQIDTLLKSGRLVAYEGPTPRLRQPGLPKARQALPEAGSPVDKALWQDLTIAEKPNVYFDKKQVMREFNKFSFTQKQRMKYVANSEGQGRNSIAARARQIAAEINRDYPELDADQNMPQAGRHVSMAKRWLKDAGVTSKNKGGRPPKAP